MYICIFIYVDCQQGLQDSGTAEPRLNCEKGAEAGNFSAGDREHSEHVVYSRLQKVGIWMWGYLGWVSFFLWFGLGGLEDSHIPTFWPLPVGLYHTPFFGYLKRGMV